MSIFTVMVKNMTGPVDLYTAALAAEVRAEVAAQGIKTKEFEDRLGLVYYTYNRYFVTCTLSPNLKTLTRLAEGLGMTLLELIERVETRLLRMKAQGASEASTPVADGAKAPQGTAGESRVS